MSGGKSFIPPRFQVPVAIVLAVLFAALLWWRFQPRAALVAPVTESIEIPGDAKLATLEDLRGLLATIKPGEDTPARSGQDYALLSNNPFHLPLATASGKSTSGSIQGADSDDADVSLPDEEARVKEDLKQGRALLLASLELTGTCRSNGWAMAVISGNYVQRGDVFAGFTVKEIREREVVLHDAVGEEVLHVIEASLPAPGGFTASSASGAIAP